MELAGSKELVITNDALKYAKIIAAPIENEMQRKRAFASIVALDAFADYLVTQDINVSITKNLFKIAPVNEEFEISDIYYNGWKLDVRLVVNDEFVSIPKSHFKFDILADMYIAIKVDSKLENAELVGFIDGKKISKTIDNGAYYLMNVENLSPVEELIAELQTPKDITNPLTDHSAFSSLYLAYLDNDIDTIGKKTFIRHISACAECRSDFVEFYDFEAIVKNSALCPEIFEDHTLAIVGGQVIDQEQYAGKEELIIIRDDEPEKLEKAKSSETSVESNDLEDLDGPDGSGGLNFLDESDNSDILGELFENSHDNVLAKNSDSNHLLSAGVIAAGVIGAGAVIASATTANAATTSTLEAGMAVAEASANLISSSAKLLNNNLDLDDLTLDEPEPLIEQSPDSDFLAELADLSADNGDYCDLTLFDADLDIPEVDEKVQNLETVDSVIEDDEISLLEDFSADDNFLNDEPLETMNDDLEVSVNDEELIYSPSVDEDFIHRNEDESLDFDLMEEQETFLDDELTIPVDESDGDISQDDALISGSDDSLDFNSGETSDFLVEDDEVQSQDMDFLQSIDDEGPSYDFMDSDSKGLFEETEEVSQAGVSSYDEFGNDINDIGGDETLTMLDDTDDDFVGISTSDEEKEEASDEDNFMSFYKQDDNFIQDETGYSFESSEQTISDEEQPDEFNNFINAGNEMKDDDEEGEIESLDNEIQLSYSSEDEAGEVATGEIDSVDGEDQLTYMDENEKDDEEESSDGGFLTSNPSRAEDQDQKELQLLYENKNDSEDTETNEQIEYIMNKEDGLSIFKDKKMVILASCFVGCLLFGTIFGISAHNNKNKIDKENAELANQQLMDQTGEINQTMGSMTPIPMGDAPVNQTATGEALAKGSTATVHKDMDKVMTNVFDENPSTVAVTKIAWEVSQSIAQNELFSKYLQIAGKNLQLNLKNDLINATEFAYNDKVKVLIVIGKDNNIKKLEILSTSGSEQIDELVLQSIKETLKYINVPQLPDSPVPSQHNLAKDNEYNLKLAINF